MRVVAVVLAAGAGSRMGGPKALLRVGPLSFLELCLRALDRPRVGAAVVVVGHRAAEVRAIVPPRGTLTVAENPAYRTGMLSSVIAGLDAAAALAADAVLLHPVDHPRVEEDTVERVLDALDAGAIVAVPSNGGRRGHPGGFARAAWPALRSAPPDRGARAVLADHPEWIVHVEGGAGSVEGFNTPADLARIESEDSA